MRPLRALAAFLFAQATVTSSRPVACLKQATQPLTTAMEANPERRLRDAERTCCKRRRQILPGDEQERLAISSGQLSQPLLELRVEDPDLWPGIRRRLWEVNSNGCRRRPPPFGEQQVPRCRKQPRAGVVHRNVRKLPPGDCQRLSGNRLRIAAAAPTRVGHNLRKMKEHVPEPGLCLGGRIVRHTRYCRREAKPLHTSGEPRAAATRNPLGEAPHGPAHPEQLGSLEESQLAALRGHSGTLARRVPFCHRHSLWHI